MTKFTTSIFLAVLLVDLASAASSASRRDIPEPPQGVRRMIETLESKDFGDYQCALEARERGFSVKQRSRVCRGRW
jgi:hypothetical protein